jgi:hypothetical protein
MGDEYGGSSQNLLRAPYWESASHRAQKTVRVESANALRSFGGIWGGGGVGRHLGCGGAAKAERRRCAQIQVAPIAVPPPLPCTYDLFGLWCAVPAPSERRRVQILALQEPEKVFQRFPKGCGSIGSKGARSWLGASVLMHAAAQPLCD